MSENLAKVLSRRPVLAGQLHKYTNVVKGWQYRQVFTGQVIRCPISYPSLSPPCRYFMVDELSGFLNYYVTESKNGPEQDQVPRGQVHLAGAQICPSDEDSRTFTVSCASADTIKLRAVDARARQEWVDGLRAISESHTLALSSSSLQAREHLAAHDALGAVRQQLHQTEICNAQLAKLIESLDSPAIPPTDPHMLTLKALSGANTHVLQQCLGILQREVDGSEIEAA